MIKDPPLPYITMISFDGNRPKSSCVQARRSFGPGIVEACSSNRLVFPYYNGRILMSR